MAAKDIFHTSVKIALQKENWVITDDPLRLEVGGTKFEIDLGAKSLLLSVKVKKLVYKSNLSSVNLH
ncbi:MULTISPECIES: element excision factor XisH family protein [unclassified Microcoleus]|uniref:element excision factor XisH family protein n=1 Tax=unclassified Microcoleus TaxID=2642155 RepID=UPI002FD641F9